MKIMFRSSITSAAYELRLYKEVDGKLIFAKPMEIEWGPEFEEMSSFEYPPATLKLTFEAMRSLKASMADELTRIGWMPDNHGAAEQMKTQSAHLADMQKLAHGLAGVVGQALLGLAAPTAPAPMPATIAADPDWRTQ